MDLKELENGIDPSTNWYYQSKKIPLLVYFDQVVKKENRKVTVLDFGAGSGFFAYELLKVFPKHINEVLLIDTGYSEEEIDATKNEQVKKLRSLPGGISDCFVLMMDVLEHIKDDYAILDDIRSRLGENAYFFITVPAFMSLWSNHDIYLGHYRRYTLSHLNKLLTGSNYSIEQQYYIYGSIFPLVWFIRRVKKLTARNHSPKFSDMKPLPGPLNFLLKKYNSFEMKFRKMNKIFGVTCVVEGRF